MSRPRYTPADRVRRDEGTRNWPTTARGKLRCPTCPATGYPGGSWIDKHLAGHPHVCPRCNAAYATGQGLASHRRATSHT